MFVDRQLYLQTMVKHLSEDGKKNKIHTNTSVESFKQDADGVTATTEDGRSFRGDILIGADGVHSKVREMTSPELKKGKQAASPYHPSTKTGLGPMIDLAAEYNCVFGISNITTTTPMELGMVYNTYDVGVSAVCVSGVGARSSGSCSRRPRTASPTRRMCQVSPRKTPKSLSNVTAT